MSYSPTVQRQYLNANDVVHAFAEGALSLERAIDEVCRLTGWKPTIASNHVKRVASSRYRMETVEFSGKRVKARVVAKPGQVWHQKVREGGLVYLSFRTRATDNPGHSYTLDELRAIRDDLSDVIDVLEKA